mmetsp:Transcript_21882/g.32762  ORF Transcript_21882/g.32762 Transcript_21882/m.32762 type:complete len:144 (+) Transcript_21882:87-518(+)
MNMFYHSRQISYCHHANEAKLPRRNAVNMISPQPELRRSSSEEQMTDKKMKRRGGIYQADPIQITRSHGESRFTVTTRTSSNGHGNEKVKESTNGADGKRSREAMQMHDQPCPYPQDFISRRLKAIQLGATRRQEAQQNSLAA